MTFTGMCSNCKATITGTLTFESDGKAEVSPPPVIGSYCNCGTPRALAGLAAQAVPLTLREAV